MPNAKGFRLSDNIVSIIDNFKIGKNNTQKLINMLTINNNCLMESIEEIKHSFSNEELKYIKENVIIDNIEVKTPTEIKASLQKQIKEDSIKEKMIALTSFSIFALVYYTKYNL